MMNNLLGGASAALAEPDPWRKCMVVNGLYSSNSGGRLPFSSVDQPVSPLSDWPGRPDLPVLVPPEAVNWRGVATREGRAALLHAIAHIEFNAINLALDAICRFPLLPLAFHEGWLKVADEEVKHFRLVCAHMDTQYGCQYGAFPAHAGLWEMALRTAHDPLARMALIPRLFEARGLDATPAIIRKFQGIGDRQAVAILETILSEEVGHVALGDYWFRILCRERGLEPEATFQTLLAEYDAPRPRRPLNEPARLAAGFSKMELAGFH